jgi:hypothetical protein
VCLGLNGEGILVHVVRETGQGLLVQVTEFGLWSLVHEQHEGTAVEVLVELFHAFIGGCHF